MSKKVQEIMIHFVISYHKLVVKLIETSTQITMLFTNCKSRPDNSKSHTVTKYLHKLYHMYYTVVYSRETFDN